MLNLVVFMKFREAKGEDAARKLHFEATFVHSAAASVSTSIFDSCLAHVGSIFASCLDDFPMFFRCVF